MHPLLSPSRLYTRADILARPSAAPSAPGVYAWYFRTSPPGVPLDNVHRHEGCVLLYVGISPSKPRTDATKPSRQNLRKRLRAHYRGNASKVCTNFVV